MSDQINYVYIVSAGHAGSTLLDLLLGSHSDIESLGEIVHFPKNIALNTRCTCGEQVRDCPEWSKVINIYSKKLGVNLSQNPYNLDLGFIRAKGVVDKSQQTKASVYRMKIVQGLHYGFLWLNMRELSPFKSYFDRIIKNKIDFYNVVREQRGVSVVVDSSKSYIQAIELYRANPERVRLILLVRDGRAVFYSNVKRKYPRKASLNSWRHVYNRVRPLLNKFVDGGGVIQVKYEDLTVSPGSELEKITTFIGLKFEQGMLDFSSKEHHITNGNYMMFAKNSEIRFDDSWRQGLGREDCDYFERNAGKLNRAFGYE